MKISRVLLVIFFIAALLGSIVGTSYYYIKSIDSVEEQVYFQLEGVAQSRAHHVNDFIEEEKNKVLIAGTHQELLNEELKEIIEINKEFDELFVLDANGKIIASSAESRIGKDKLNDAYFIEGLKGTYIKDIYKSLETGRNSIAISTPFNDGVLVARIEINNLEKILLDKMGIGETGETYLINKNSYAITPLLYVEDAVLKQKVNSISSRNCLEALDDPMEFQGEHVGHEAVEIFLGYRGEKVIGAHYPITKINWCLLAEIDEAEVLGKQRKLFQKVSLTIIIAIVIIAILLGLFVGKFVDDAVVLKKGKKSL